MKITTFLLILGPILAACSSPKKAPARKAPPAISREDILRGGTSYGNPVVIGVKTERVGLDEEYKWLSNTYPGYTVIKRRHEKKSPKHYDIIRIRTKQGQVKDVYFDSTSFRAP